MTKAKEHEVLFDELRKYEEICYSKITNEREDIRAKEVLKYLVCKMGLLDEYDEYEEKYYSNN